MSGTMSARAGLVVGAAALAAALLAGCGFGGDSGGLLSRDEYMARVRSIQADAQPAERLYSELVIGDALSADECGAKVAAEILERFKPRGYVVLGG